jgi:hypothetical protein
VGKKLSDERIARNEVAMSRPTFRSASRRFGFAIAVLSTVIGLVGCAASDTSSDDNRRGGFYGSVSSGMSHP